MTTASAPPWESKRTDESRLVEKVLQDAGFEQVDSYRYNSASLRVRVIDSRFEGMAIENRHALVEPRLEALPEQTQADIMSLFTFAPGELQRTSRSLRIQLLNREFEDPSPSML